MESNVEVSPSGGFSQIYNSMNGSIANANPLVLIALTAIVLFYFILFSYLGYNPIAQRQEQSPGMKMIELLMWGLLVFLVLINGIQYFFKLDIKTAIKNIFQGKPEVDITVAPEKRFIEKTGNKLNKDVKKIGEEIENDLGLGNFREGGGSGFGGGEVFNVSSNKYTYDDAKALCKAYGAKLATYNQIEDAYKSGAEWCNYGWSEDQMAFYPTQKKTWKKLQKIKGHEHDCGRPGINGGFIDNPNVRFGVNCFGSKPSISEEEQDIMNNASIYPKSKEDRKVDRLVKKYKKNLDSILINPFNHNSWSQI
uniref:Link domain-containing protein n=1 Tax=viral metagenome TaxID=1070528 RepID=A0A6C0KFK5_9ZZZZ